MQFHLKENLKETDIVLRQEGDPAACSCIFFKIHFTVFDALVHLNNISDAPHIPG